MKKEEYIRRYGEAAYEKMFTEIEKNGESGLIHRRTLTLENDLTTITIKGDPKYIPRFNTGWKIQVMLINPQTQLIEESSIGELEQDIILPEGAKLLREAKEVLGQ